MKKLIMKKIKFDKENEFTILKNKVTEYEMIGYYFKLIFQNGFYFLSHSVYWMCDKEWTADLLHEVYDENGKATHLEDQYGKIYPLDYFENNEEE